MINISLQRDIDTPLYRQIVDQCSDLIRSGALQEGDRLPPVRALAGELGLTRLTVHSAYSELQGQGLIVSHVGRGTFVSGGGELEPPASSAEPPMPWVSEGVLADLIRGAERETVVSFVQAFPDSNTYPAQDLSRALQREARRPEALGYGPVQGDADLREQMARVLAGRAVAAPPEHMVVTDGAQQGIDLILRAVLKPVDVLLVEAPTYPGVLQAAREQGRRVFGVPVDEGGIRLDALESACRAYRPRMLYLIPTFGNPTGVSLAPDRREAILRLSRVYGFTVVEDDVYGFLSYDGASPPALKSLDRDDRVIYLTSFSKMLAPALRLGVIVASPGLLPSLAAAKQSADLVCSVLLQRALANYLRRGKLPEHIRQVCATYRQRRDVMVAALERHLPECTWSHPAGGLSLWLHLPSGVVERDFVRDAADRGVGLTVGHAFFAQPPADAAIRLSFGMNPPERIEEGIAMLGSVLRDHLARPENPPRMRQLAEPLV